MGKLSNKKWTLMFATVVSLMSVVSTGVTANDGTISFVGTISDATCDITGGDENQPNQGADFTVNLPPVSVTALSSAGKYAGDTRFFINLSGQNCPNNKVANVVFERAQSTNIDNTTGYLKNHTISGAAENVQVRILNNDKKPLKLNEMNADHQAVTINQNTARFEYWGQYASVNGAAKAGTVSTDVIYSITYR